MDGFQERLARIAWDLAGMLARGEYDALVTTCTVSRLPVEALDMVVAEYGHRVVEPPSDAYASLDAVRIAGAGPPTYSIRVPLWTVEEGRSDLELSATVALLADGYRVELDDLRVP